MSEHRQEESAELEEGAALEEGASQGPKVRVSLRTKLLVMATVLATVPLLFIGISLIAVNADAVERLCKENQLLALDDLSHAVDDSFQSAEDALREVSDLFGDMELDDTQRIRLVRSTVRGSGAIDNVILFDAAGRLVMSIAEEDLNSLPLPESIPEALRGEIDAYHVGSGAVAQVDGSLRVLIGVRIRVANRTTGYVLSLTPLTMLQERVESIAERHFAGQADPIFVVDDGQRIVAHPDLERAQLLQPVESEALRTMVATQLMSVAELEHDPIGQAGKYEAGDGTPMLGTTLGLRGRNWALVAQVPQSIAFESLHRMRVIVISMVAVAILAALIWGFVFAGLISSPLKRLTAFARMLAARRFEERVAVSTRDELSVLAHSMNAAAHDLQESERQLRREVEIRSDLKRYLPGELVDQIVRRERDMALGGVRQSVTVLFADVVGFTPLTEEREPEQVVALLNELFTILTEIVFRHDGTVDKFIGDCVMALWGAPSPQEDHASMALEAAEEMISWLETSNERWNEEYGVDIQLAIGVHTGDVVVGNVGSEKRMEYTAIGEVVNIAARLEAVARPQQILITQHVKEAAGRGFDYHDVGQHQLAGGDSGIRLYEVRV